MKEFKTGDIVDVRDSEGEEWRENLVFVAYHGLYYAKYMDSSPAAYGYKYCRRKQKSESITKQEIKEQLETLIKRLED